MRAYFAIAILLAAPAAAATKQTGVLGQYSDPDFNLARYAIDSASATTGGLSQSGPGFALSNVASADYGQLKVSASVAFNNYPADAFGQSMLSRSEATFLDKLSVTSVDPIGFATVNFTLSGLITGFLGSSGSFGDSRAAINLRAQSADGLSYARYEVLTNIGWDGLAGALVLTTSRYEEFALNGGAVDGGTTPGANLFGDHSWTFAYDASQPWTFTVGLGCLAYVSDSTTSNNSVNCDLGHTFTWQSISFSDPAMQPLSGATVASQSGQNYANAYSPLPGVPEPASWAMLIAGFGLVGAAARRRRLQSI